MPATHQIFVHLMVLTTATSTRGSGGDTRDMESVIDAILKLRDKVRALRAVIDPDRSKTAMALRPRDLQRRRWE